MNIMIIGLKNTSEKFHALPAGTVLELYKDTVFYKGSSYGTLRDLYEDYEVCNTNRESN